MVRQQVLWASVAAVGTTAFVSPSGAQNKAERMVRGVVYHDADADGVPDEDEAPIANIAVSNGRDVVWTDTTGAYELFIDQDDFVFVIKPTNWATPVDENNLPRFYYHHKPAGSPNEDLLYAGVAPTPPLPDSVDFGLIHSPEPDEFNVLVVADPQPYSLKQVEHYARDVVAELKREESKFGITLGDLVGDDLDLFEPLNQAQARVGIPWRNVYGNHDMNFMSPSDEHADETFERVYGPPTYAFEHGDVHFIMLDNVVWKGFDGYDDDGSPRTGNYEGGLRDDQLDFVRNYLNRVPRTELVVLAMHIPLDGPDPHRVPQTGRLLEILSSHPRTLSLSGHTHYQKHWFMGTEYGYNRRDGLSHHHYNVGTASGSWWRGAPDDRSIPHTLMRDGTPNGYAVITFRGNEYDIRYQAARQPAHETFRLHFIDEIVANATEPTRFAVNLYNGTPRDRLYARLEDGALAELRRVEQPDPAYVALREREMSSAGQGPELPEPVDCAHLWHGALPAGLGPGMYVLEIGIQTVFMDEPVFFERPFVVAPEGE